MQLCKLFCTASTEESPYLVVNDLTKHDTYKDQCLVKEGPMLRFLACVPLRSPLYKMIVGTYIVVDDKPRDGLSDDEVEFLKDLGITCMDHLGQYLVNYVTILLTFAKKRKGTTESSTDLSV